MYDRLCNFVCLGLAEQRGNQLTREIQCAADAAASDDPAIGDCVFLFLLCSNQHILPRKCKPIMPDPFLRHAKGHQFCVVFFIHDLF